MDPVTRFVRMNSAELASGNKTFEDVYRIVFRNEANIMAETSEGFRIVSHTYGQCAKRIAACSSGIYARFGSGSYIGLFGENSVEWLILFWSILRSGNKPYLINLMQPGEFTEEMLSSLGASAVLYTDKQPEFGFQTASCAELEEEGLTASSANVPFGNEIALSTSGTTLQKKICIYTGREICDQILNCDRIIRMNPDIKEFYHGRLKMLMFLPLYHIFGLEASYLWFAFGNITFVFLPNMTPDAILHTVRRHEVTHIFGVPLLWHTVEKGILRELKARDEKTRRRFWKGVDLSIKLQSAFPKIGKKIAARMFAEVRSAVFGDSVLFCITGGSYIRSSALKLINAIGYPLYNGYGMSEIGITSVELSRRASKRVLGSVGQPFESIEYRLGSGGELYVRGSSVCKRVIVNGDETESSEWFDTGDIMHVGKDGRYFIDGRRSDVVFGENGENLNPDYAERAFSLTDAASFVVMGDEKGEKLCLYVQIPRTLLEAKKQRLRAEIEACADKLPPAYRISRVMYTYDPLMTEDSIKVSRAYVRQKLESGEIKLFDSIESASKDVGPIDDEIRGILRGIFARVLVKSEDEILPDAHFMNELGGSSLDYFTLISEVDKRFDVRFDFEQDGFAYTLDDMAKRVEEMLRTP